MPLDKPCIISILTQTNSPHTAPCSPAGIARHQGIRRPAVPRHWGDALGTVTGGCCRHCQQGPQHHTSVQAGVICIVVVWQGCAMETLCCLGVCTGRTRPPFGRSPPGVADQGTEWLEADRAHTTQCNASPAAHKQRWWCNAGGQHATAAAREAGWEGNGTSDQDFSNSRNCQIACLATTMENTIGVCARVCMFWFSRNCRACNNGLLKTRMCLYAGNKDSAALEQSHDFVDARVQGPLFRQDAV